MVLTSSDHVSGMDRIAEVIDEIPDAEIIINIQGDEPLIEADVIDSVDFLMTPKLIFQQLLVQN